VAISDRTRKILWARAGGRCSICRTIVVTEETETDAPSVFGEEAHIISAAPNGPRAGDLPDHDVYGNLILLCSKDHKRVDDQVAHYTVALLSTIKRDHERWITGLGDGSSRPRLVPDPTRPAAKALYVVTSGSALWDLASGSDVMRPSWPSGLSEDQQDLIAAFLDDLRDWGDVHSLEGSYQAGRHAAKALSTHVANLNEAGLQVGARIRHLLLTDGTRDPMPWRELDIQIRPLTLARDIAECASQHQPPH
jgi:hypothetical protein